MTKVDVVDLGMVIVPTELIHMVNDHKASMLSNCHTEELYNTLLDQSFSFFFGDFLLENYNKLKKED